MELKNVLLLSASVVYKNMIRNALAELSDNASLLSEDNETKALELIKNNLCELIIIDTTVMPKNIFGFINELSGYKMHIILLCEQSEFDKNNYHKIRHVSLSTIIKQTHSDYYSNYKSIKRGLRYGIVKIRDLEDGMTEIVAPSNERIRESFISYELLLIASSTGGPSAIERVFSGLPKKLGIPVLIVQHMPPGFTYNFAANLSRSLDMDFREAKDGDELINDRILIAPGGYHMVINNEKKISVTDGELVNGVKPSADILFESVANQYKGRRILVIVLTGMGSDGKNGVQSLSKQCNIYCITQDEESCVVYGMPRSVVEARLSDATLNINKIAGAITQKLGLRGNEEETS